MEDVRIVELFFARDESAIEQAKIKYGRYCRSIARNILGDERDAEEAENDTFLQAWNAIPPAKPDPLRAYLAALCRNIALDKWDALRAKKRGGGQTEQALDELSDIVSGSESGEGFADALALKDAMNAFLRELPEQTRKIFLQRYWFLRSLREIADEFGMKENTVAVTLARTREKLKKHLEKEGIQV